jgi:ATP-dependent protease Clp ATPase subunit
MTEILTCSFCEKSEREVAALINGHLANICAECVAICVAVLDEHRIDPHWRNAAVLLPAMEVARDG